MLSVGGVAVYSPLSAREFANYHGLGLRFARGLMVITQRAAVKGWYLTNAEKVEELQSSQGSLMTSMTSMSSRRKGRRSDRRDGAKGPVRCLPLPHLRGQTAEVPHGDHRRRGGAAGITARSSAAARAAATTDGITSRRRLGGFAVPG